MLARGLHIGRSRANGKVERFATLHPTSIRLDILFLIFWGMWSGSWHFYTASTNQHRHNLFSLCYSNGTLWNTNTSKVADVFFAFAYASEFVIYCMLLIFTTIVYCVSFMLYGWETFMGIGSRDTITNWQAIKLYSMTDITINRPELEVVEMLIFHILHFSRTTRSARVWVLCFCFGFGSTLEYHTKR